MLLERTGNESLEKTSQSIEISMVIIQSTTFCNLDCDYCYLPDRQLKRQLSLDLIEPIFAKIFTSQFLKEELTIVWHAGEPLAMPTNFYQAVFEKIDELKSQYNLPHLSITHLIQTNGTLINQDWCDLFKHYRVKVGISIDGPKFIHDAHRKTRTGLGTHTATMRGISCLQANEITFSVIAVLTSLSLDYPDEIFKFFLDNNIKYIGFNIEEIEGTHQFSSLKSEEMERKFRAFMQRFYQLTQLSEGKISVREFEQAEFFIRQPRDLSRGQYSPFLMVNIAHNGDFSTFSPELLSMQSPIYGNFILGNVLTDPLESITTTEKFQRLHKDIQAGVHLCQQTCPYFSVCGGGAPSNKYFENESFATSETMYCRYMTQIIADVVLEGIENRLGLN